MSLVDLDPPYAWSCPAKPTRVRWKAKSSATLAAVCSTSTAIAGRL